MYVRLSSAVRPADDEQEWLFGEGLTLPVPVEYDTTLASASYTLASRWDKARSTDVSELDFEPGDLSTMDTNQISPSPPSRAGVY